MYRRDEQSTHATIERSRVPPVPARRAHHSACWGASFRAVGGFGVGVADEVGEGGVAEGLVDAHVFAGVVPVVINGAM